MSYKNKESYYDTSVFVSAILNKIVIIFGILSLLSISLFGVTANAYRSSSLRSSATSVRHSHRSKSARPVTLVPAPIGTLVSASVVTAVPIATPVTPTPTSASIATPAPTSAPASVVAPTSEIVTESWIYPGNPTCSAATEYDNNQIDTLKPEYYQVQSDGTLQQMTVASDGCNAYSAANVADVKAHSVHQFATVSGDITGIRALFSSASLQNATIATLTNFAVSSGFTGIELDWEGFSNWTTTDYSNYKNFTTALQNSLHANGKKLMIDAPAISDSTSQGYSPFHYEDFTSVDYTAIMAYDYQYDYGVGQPVAPLSWITSVANYAKSKLPVGHIVIGIPAYGYHGTLGSYSMTIDTYAESSTLPGFSTRKVNSEGEETWMVGNTYYCDQPPSALDMKKTLLESLGIQNISVWHIGGNNWF